MTIMSASRAQENKLRNTYCSRGHVHPPWNTTGVLRIAKCESVCGFCQKETKTAANLRKHVAIHIKNEGLSLTIAEGSSGRGRLEMPPSELQRRSSSASTKKNTSPPADSFSAPAVLLSMSHPSYGSPPSTYQNPVSASTHSSPSPISSNTYTTLPQPYNTIPTATTSPFQEHLKYPPHFDRMDTTPDTNPHTHIPLPPVIRHYRQQNDPFYALRSHNLSTKIAWTAIPAAEGQRILDICKRNSSVDEPSKASVVMTSPTSTAPVQGADEMRGSGTLPIPEAGIHLPCYNRKVLYDEEWQAHMRDVHGVFLLWPDTWMKRVEVLDLDPFGGDIGACNGVIMDG